MSLEQISSSAREWIKQNPMETVRDLPPAITTKRRIDEAGNFLPEGETIVPRLPGMSEKMQGLLTDFFNHGDLDALTPKQRRFMLPYISEDISIKGLAERESVIYQDAYSGIRTGLQTAFFSLPPEIRRNHVLKDILKLKTTVATSGQRHPGKVAISVNPNDRKPSPRSAEIHRYVISSALGRTKVIINPVPHNAGDMLPGIRRQNEAAMAKRDKKLEDFLRTAYDMTPEEREEKPLRGALFNWVFVRGLPQDLIQYYVDHPILSIERWESFNTNPNAPFVTFAEGKVCYVIDWKRVYQSAYSINDHFRSNNPSGDPAAFRKFAMLRWPDIAHDVEITARLAGYRKPLLVRA